MSPFPAVNDEEFSVETRDTSPANLLMKIESFSLLPKYEIFELESREFEAGGYKWRMVIYPDGFESERQSDSKMKKRKRSEDEEEDEDEDDEDEEEEEEEEEDEEEEDGEVEEDKEEEEKDKHVCVCLSASDTNSLPVDWEINVIFTFFLYNQISDNYLCFRGKTRRFSALNPKWRFPKLMSKKTLIDPSKGYLVDGNCVFGAEVFVIKGQRINECWSLLKDTTPYKRDWKLSNFSKMEDEWNSEEFEAGDHKWNVGMHPKGDAVGEGRYISIFLNCVDAEGFKPYQKVRAEVVMNIKSKFLTHSSETFSHWFTHKDISWGYSDFLSIDDLNDPSKGFLVDDCCILEIEITVQALVLDAPKT